MAGTGWVTMRFGDDPAAPTQDTTRKAFNEVWAPKGWQEVDPVAAHAAVILGEPVADVNKLSKEKVRVLASQAGLDVDEKATKDELLDAVAASVTGEDAETTEEAING